LAELPALFELVAAGLPALTGPDDGPPVAADPVRAMPAFGEVAVAPDVAWPAADPEAEDAPLVALELPPLVAPPAPAPPPCAKDVVAPATRAMSANEVMDERVIG